MASHFSGGDATRSLDEEREYIEELLNKRFNYFLLFISFLFIPVTSSNALSSLSRAMLLFLGGFVSAIMAYMIARTRRLLDALLDEIRSAKHHPYRRAFDTVRLDHPFFGKNVNELMSWVVFTIMAFFLAGGALTLIKPEHLFQTCPPAAATK